MPLSYSEWYCRLALYFTYSHTVSPAPPSPSQKFLTSVHKTSQKLDNFCEDTAEISLAIRGQKSPSSLLPTKWSSQGRRWNFTGWFVKLGAATAKYESKCQSLRRLLERVCAGGRHAATLVVVGGKMRALDDVRPLTISDKRSRHDTSSTWPSLSTPQPLKSTTTTTSNHQYSVHLYSSLLSMSMSMSIVDLYSA